MIKHVDKVGTMPDYFDLIQCLDCGTWVEAAIDNDKCSRCKRSEQAAAKLDFETRYTGELEDLEVLDVGSLVDVSA